MSEDKENTCGVKGSLPLKWHGGKQYLADKIITMMPEHIHYVEPYFGGGAVLFRKPCEGVSEVVNDLNGELMNFWSILKIDTSFKSFQRIIETTPFSEDTFSVVKHSVEDRRLSQNYLNDLDRAYQFFVKYRMSRQGLGKEFATLTRNRTRRGMNEQVSAWLSAVEGLPECHERLKRVVILNKNALDVIKQQDGPNTLFYCDPPYLHETRTAKGTYGEYEMSKKDHWYLITLLSTVRGKFLLSGYHSELYDSYAAQEGWTCKEFSLPNNASGAKKKRRMVECVWKNY